MRTRIEVFADITCPFTHVGLKRVVGQLAARDADVDLVVRAWPLEWVNGELFAAEAIAAKIAVLRDQLGVADFDGFRPDTWPTTTIPALNLCAAATAVDLATGLRVALDVRAALFERGIDIGDHDDLARLAGHHGLEPPDREASAAVQADYTEGQRRGVRGSPDFWVGDAEFFCPTVDLRHAADGTLQAEFDPEGLDRFIATAVA